MMLYPPMNVLAEKAGSRYLLVNLVARRARNIAAAAQAQVIQLVVFQRVQPHTCQIAAAAQAAGEPLDTKPVSMAIDEVYDGRLQVVHKE